MSIATVAAAATSAAATSAAVAATSPVATSAAVAATSAAHGHTAAGLARARADLIPRGDLGVGWRVQSPPPRPIPALSCPGFSPRLTGVKETGAAASPTFAQSADGPFLAQIAYVYASDRQRQTVWRRVVTPRLETCVAGALRQGSVHGAQFTVTARRRLRLPRLAAQRAGYRVQATVTGSGQTVPIYLDMLVLGRGASISELSVTSIGTPVSSSLETRLARRAAALMSIG